MTKAEFLASMLPPKPDAYSRRGPMREYSTFCRVDDVAEFYAELTRRLEALYDSSVEVIGCANRDDMYFGTEELDSDTHTARLICIEPIKPKDERVSQAEILQMLRDDYAGREYNKLADRIEKHGIKPE